MLTSGLSVGRLRTSSPKQGGNGNSSAGPGRLRCALGRALLAVSDVHRLAMRRAGEVGAGCARSSGGERRHTSEAPQQLWRCPFLSHTKSHFTMYTMQEARIQCVWCSIVSNVMAQSASSLILATCQLFWQHDVFHIFKNVFSSSSHNRDMYGNTCDNMCILLLLHEVY